MSGLRSPSRVPAGRIPGRSVTLLRAAVIELDPRSATIACRQDPNGPHLAVTHALGELSDELAPRADRSRPTHPRLRSLDQVEWNSG